MKSPLNAEAPRFTCINTAWAKRPARREVRCNKMGSCFVDEIDKRGVTTASTGGPGADEALVAAAKDGDEQAFGVLIERDHQRTLALALRLNGTLHAFLLVGAIAAFRRVNSAHRRPGA
jgi:hypothetical protein